ncbi:MAG: LLM class flavin-dependent oxidoreductase [Gammaproteobacteria bacterium]|nr:LLM class flavin-dependent oxidoreductase [Gammaproteobacteria bacterium]
MKFGLLSLGDCLPSPIDGIRPTDHERHRNIIEQGVRAEQLGYHIFCVGEHHLCDYILSAPPVLLAAVAERTRQIRLGTGTTLVPTLDPVRMAEDYGTLDAISNGRVEVMAGRGVVPRTYRDFGYEFAASKDLYERHIETLIEAWSADTADLTAHRPSLAGVSVKPRPVQSPHPPVWVGGGFSESSVHLAARLGLGLMLPSIVVPPTMFKDLVALYRDEFCDRGRGGPKIGALSHTHVAAKSQEARSRFEPHQRAYLEWVTKELIPWGTEGEAAVGGPFADYDFNAAASTGPVLCGSPAEVIERLGAFDEVLGIDLHLVMMDQGSPPLDQLEQSMQLFAEEVAPHLSSD